MDSKKHVPTKEIWRLAPENPEDSRRESLLTQAYQRIADQNSMILRVIRIPAHPHNRDNRVISTEEDWKDLLPNALKNELTPAILVSDHPNFVIDKEAFPNTFLVWSGHTSVMALIQQSAKKPDMILIPKDVYSLNKVAIRSKHPGIDSIIQEYLLEKCSFDPARYRQACEEVSSAATAAPKKITFTLLVGDLSDIETSQANRLLNAIKVLQKKYDAKILISTSKRTESMGAGKLRDTFAGGPAAVEFLEKANLSVDNPYYRFLAEADAIFVLDSGSMAAEAAHTGKPVYADADTIYDWNLGDYVRPLNEETTLNEPKKPTLDIAGGIADAVTRMYSEYKQKKQPVTRAASVAFEGRIGPRGKGRG